MVKRKMIKVLYIVPVFLFCMALILSGQSKVGTAGFQFLEISPSARGSGMGSAFSAISDDASALYYNPAGISYVKKYELLTNGIQYPAGIRIGYAGLVIPISPLFGNIGFSFTSLFLDEAMKVTEPMLGGQHGNWTGEYFLCYQYAAQMSYGKALTDRFSAGINLRFVRSTLDDRDNTSSQVIAGDIGTLYDTQFRSIKLGIVITNFGPDAAYKSYDATDPDVEAYDHESFPLPMAFRVGISAVPYQSGPNKVTIDIEGEHPNHNYERAYVGMEYNFNNMFFIRSGYKIGHDSERWSAGGGIHVPIAIARLKVDYAYTDYSYLINIHRMSVGLLF
jgi:hypothetical protein